MPVIKSRIPSPKPFRVAMPIAHITGNASYSKFYHSEDKCIFAVKHYFNQARCKGIHLSGDAGNTGQQPLDPRFNLYAFTDGYLSFQDKTRLQLRLHKGLKDDTDNLDQFNAGKHFLNLVPHGPCLRHVIYQFVNTPDNNSVHDQIFALLIDVTHTMRRISTTLSATTRLPVSLDEYLSETFLNSNEILSQFMEGSLEIFVQAGDIIGNFAGREIELQFIDSCANQKRFLKPPTGRHLSPAYYLHLLLKQVNASKIEMLTAGIKSKTHHPLYQLLDRKLLSRIGNPDIGIDLDGKIPSPPLHVRVPVKLPSGQVIPMGGIPIAALSEFHQSRNSSKLATDSPIEWRLNEDQTGVDVGRFIARRRPGKESLVPSGDKFDINFDPDSLLKPDRIHSDRVKVYWKRYGAIYNAVALLYEVPIELLLMISCVETSYLYNPDHPDFKDSQEAVRVRMEPLKRDHDANSPIIKKYKSIAGIEPSRRGANANIPIPWKGKERIHPAESLTWDELAALVKLKVVMVSPGVMQTQVASAIDDIKWANDFYGSDHIQRLTITHNNIVITADEPPSEADKMLSHWFGVAVDTHGVTTHNASSVDLELTKIKRALHGIAAGALHIKGGYNTKAGKTVDNVITDWDLPTVCCRYNSHNPADINTVAKVRDNNKKKWHLLFGLRFWDENYPQNAPYYYNAAVHYFNTGLGTALQPAVRLWKG